MNTASRILPRQLDLLQQRLEHAVGVRMNTRLILWPILCTALLAAYPCRAAELFVSPQGSDTNSGTLARPFATLERARDAARRLRRTAIPPKAASLSGSEAANTSAPMRSN